MSKYPKVKDPNLVGSYDVLAKAGGGYVWDHVLEYRGWCHLHDGDDYYHAFKTCEEALKFIKNTEGAEELLALILQEEYIDEPEPEQYVHIKEQRIAEWPVEFLNRPRRTENTIPDFLAPDAPENRLDIIRGLT